MIQGACHCGTVRFTISGPVTQFEHCHCNTCRKFHGSVYGSSAMAREADFTLTAGEDDLTAYCSSPDKQRVFCRHCGSHVFAKEDGAAQVILRVGTLAPGHGLLPEAHIYVSDRVPWCEIADGLPQHIGSSEE